MTNGKHIDEHPKEKKEQQKSARRQDTPKSPSIDYTRQARIKDDTPAPQDLGHYLFALASEVSRRWRKENRSEGMLFVIGKFKTAKRDGKVVVKGMRQLGKNPFENRLLRADSPEFAEMVFHGEEIFGDGAVVIDAGGQVLGSGAYLVVDHPDVHIPEEGGSRHLAAASASLRKDVEAVVVVSEETGRVRLFENGKVTAFFDPSQEDKSKETRS